MRERLIKLIQEAVPGCAMQWIELLADYLIEDGLIAPPCKIGDTVYVVHGWDDVRIVEDGCAGFNIDCDGVNIIPKMREEETDGSASAVCATREEAESVKAKIEEEYREWQERKEREFVEECKAKGLDPAVEKQRMQEARSYWDKKLLNYATTKLSPRNGKTVEFRRWEPFDVETLMQDEQKEGQ